MRGILGYGTYVPHHRLRRTDIAASLGQPGGAGTRAVASFDEDSTSMGVEAARAALRTARVAVDHVLFATTSPAYAEKTNATTIRAALAVGLDGYAGDVGASVRSAFGAWRAGLTGDGCTLVVCADVRTGLPGGVDERDGGDAANALLLGDAAEDSVLAEYVGGASVTEEFLDRWRAPGDAAARVWEERFAEAPYIAMAERALSEALKKSGLAVGDIDRAVFSGVHSRAVRVAARRSGLPSEALVQDRSDTIGNTGAAHAGLLLADALDAAAAGQVVAVVTLADGVDVALFRTTSALVEGRATRGHAQPPPRDVSYLDFLTWRGTLRREPPRRPDPSMPAAPPAYRNAGWKFAVTASRCESCSTRHLPPQRVCFKCEARDQMTAENMSDVRARIATFTIDRLAYSMSPPVVAAVLDFDGGGRLLCELTDVDADSVRIGDPVELTFRRLHTANDVHNYFWKAKPVKEESA